jgi:ParB family transcriptional regulator, chromosome partitioning protein
MIATKRHDYVPYGTIHKHPLIENHRAVNRSKVLHYKGDILRNGLLEPLVVWERNHNEYFLVGGFHRFSAITLIREDNPGYFDRVDVRVVSGELEEMRALNLKLNADRLDARLSEYFDTVVFLNNANWSKQRIADFLDRSVSWVEEIVRFVPSMDPRLRKLLDEDKVSWSKARGICRRVLAARPGTETDVIEASLKELREGPVVLPRRVLSPKSATKRLTKHVAEHPKMTYTVSGQDLLSLVTLLTGPREAQQDHLQRVRERFPALLDTGAVEAESANSNAPLGPPKPGAL